jgi:hypothetical protein
MKLIDDRSTLSAMADEIVAGRAEHPTGALRLLGIPDGSAAERRLLRKWAGSGCFVAMRGAARRALIAAWAEADDLRESADDGAYQRGLRDGKVYAMALVAPTAPTFFDARRPSIFARLFGVRA